MRWIIVGAGSGGCVAAGRLADDPANDVVLVEHGPGLAPGEVPSAIEGSDFLASFDETGRSHEGLTARRGDVSMPYRRGRGIGGSSAVNAMIALRGDADQYREWGWDDVDEAWSRLRLPEEHPADTELGPLDRALLDADASARRSPLTRRDRRRVTSAEAYLWPVWDNPNLTVMTEAAVAEILLDGRRATGVRLADGSEVAGDRVVVAAGAIHTPWLLARSGVAIEGIGSGLEDHPALTLTVELEQPVFGGLASAVHSVHGPLQLLALNRTGTDEVGLRHGALLIGLMQPSGPPGSVRLAADPDAPPEIELGPLSDRRDVDALEAGLHLARDLLGRAAFQEVVREVYVDDHGTRLAQLGDDRFREWIETAGTYLHATSTCAMGRVVRSDGAVVGHEALYVCDASVFPAVPHVNTHLPTAMLAERLSARWAPVRRR